MWGNIQRQKEKRRKKLKGKKYDEMTQLEKVQAGEPMVRSGTVFIRSNCDHTGKKDIRIKNPHQSDYLLLMYPFVRHLWTVVHALPRKPRIPRNLLAACRKT